MNDLQKEIFVRHLNSRLHKEVLKDELVQFANNNGINIDSKLKKSEMLAIIEENNLLNKLYDEYNKLFYTSVSEVCSLLQFEPKKLYMLIESGLLKDEIKLYYKTKFCPLSILEYTKEELENIYNEAFANDFFKVRIETQKEIDISRIITELSKLFEIKKLPVPYEHRDKSGFYNYLQIRLFPNSNNIRGNKLTQENLQLKQRNLELENQQKNIENIMANEKSIIIEENSKKIAERMLIFGKGKFSLEEINELTGISIEDIKKSIYYREKSI